jgi:hypothetical protein
MGNINIQMQDLSGRKSVPMDVEADGGTKKGNIKINDADSLNTTDVGSRPTSA